MLTFAGLGMLTLAGCGIGPAAVSTPQSVVLPAISGKVMGGETPISSANIILWETDPGNTGYGVATNGSSIGAQQLATATTGIGGGFSFTAGSYTCAPGQFAYLTSTGGDASDGGGTEINNNLVMVAALGSCSNFSGTAAENNIIINVNELSTVAAAYTLGSFMTINDNGNAGTQLVYIGAPANNNATSGSCSGSGTSMSCTAAGLSHAFNNANNLVDAVHYDGTAPTGLARTSVPGITGSSVPQALINSLGDIMSYCTQSPGGTGGTTNCGKLFTDTTPTGSSSTAPTDTLSAMVNIARQPYINVSALFGLISGTPPWTGLTAHPAQDWSIAVAYTGPSLGSAPITAYSSTTGTVTFTAANSFTAGEPVTLSGFGTSTFLNGLTTTVLSTGLSSSQFEANIIDNMASSGSFSITSNVATFTVISNNFVAGDSVYLNNFATGTYFNGSTVTVLSAGLSATQFEANFTHANVASTADATGTAGLVASATENGTASEPGYGSPQYLALDANDNVYIQTSNAYAPTASGMAAMTNGGSSLWANVPSITTCTNGQLASDNVGNIWLTLGASTTSACTYGLYGYNAVSGSLTASFQPGNGTVCSQTSPTSSNCPGFSAYDTTHLIQSLPSGIAFDRFNNMWYDRSSSTCANCIIELPYSTSLYSAHQNYGGPQNIQNNASGTLVKSNKVIVDSGGNVWSSNYQSTSGTSGIIALLPNTGNTTTPAYAGSTGSGCLQTTNEYYCTATLSSYDNGDISLDALGNVWTGSNDKVYEYSPTVSGSTSTIGSSTSQTATTTASHPSNGEVDGGANYWYPSLTASGNIFVQITPASALYNSTTAAKNTEFLQPCYVPSAGTTCNTALVVDGTQTYVTGDSHVVQVDSAGAIWAASGSAASVNTGFVVQILGPGTPTWPQLSYGVFGKEPQ